MFTIRQILISIIVILLVVTYAQYYIKFNKGYRIIQSHVHNIDDKVLYEKYPIIIHDRLVNPESLLKTLFSYMYTFKSIHQVHGSIYPYMTNNKFCIIYNSTNDININLISPIYKKTFKPFASYNGITRSQKTSLDKTSVEYVTIKLKQKQVLILPFGWLYQTQHQHSVISLNDMFSHLVSVYFVHLG